MHPNDCIRSQRYWYNHVYYSSIHNNHEMESAEMFISWWVYNNYVVHIHNGIVLSHKENEIMQFSGKWKCLELKLCWVNCARLRQMLCVLCHVDLTFWYYVSIFIWKWMRLRNWAKKRVHVRKEEVLRELGRS